MIIREFGPDAVLYEPDGLPSSPVERARVLLELAKSFGEEDAVVGSRSVLVSKQRSAENRSCAAPLQPEPREHRIGLVYDGPDLAVAAEMLALSVDELIDRHQRPTYVATLGGFLPGFAYLSGLDSGLVLPRRASPRPRVEALSVGIAGGYTGIYPFVSPGGWTLLGRATAPSLFDPRLDPPTLINLLDRVRFERVESPKPTHDTLVEPELPAGPVRVRVTKLGGLATVQDGGRLGWRRFGVPTGGPLDRESFDRLCGAREPAIELALGSIEFAIEAGSTWVGIAGEQVRWLRPGDKLRVDAGADLVRYIRFGGELQLPPVLGSRSTLLGASWAGPLGVPLRKGQLLTFGSPEAPPANRFPATEPLAEELLLHLHPTEDPRIDKDALPALLEQTRTVSSLSNRVGTRLDGSAIHLKQTAIDESHPMVPGAVQVTPEGTPIVLGPDSATMGGYPVIAVLDQSSRSRLGRSRPGQRIRLRLKP
jgi:KipI family sensor histidine kinase inhibitor